MACYVRIFDTLAQKQDQKQDGSHEQLAEEHADCFNTLTRVRGSCQSMQPP